jgi:hypothetical protein
MKDERGFCGQVSISGVRFEDLGRTNKLEITSPMNQQMMYALQFRRCDAPEDRKSHDVIDSVMVNTLGWDFVNHGSDVISHGNVAYDFAGAGRRIGYLPRLVMRGW